MKVRGRTLRFTAVLVFVVLSLTGFSTGKSRGHGHHHNSGHSGGGGGCDSSHQDHDGTRTSYHDTDDDAYDDSADDSTGGTTGGTADDSAYLEDATVKLLSCATGKKPYATVEVTNPNDTGATFSVAVYYKDARSRYIDFDEVDVTVPAQGRRTAQVPFDKAYLPRLDHCEPQSNATVVS